MSDGSSWLHRWCQGTSQYEGIRCSSCLAPAAGAPRAPGQARRHQHAAPRHKHGAAAAPSASMCPHLPCEVQQQLVPQGLQPPLVPATPEVTPPAAAHTAIHAVALTHLRASTGSRQSLAPVQLGHGRSNAQLASALPIRKALQPAASHLALPRYAA